jgi:formyl-CoA transferase
VVENWRPGTATRLGLDARALREHNPSLVICSISGYGQDGDARAGYDQIVQGTSGVMSMTGPPGEPTKWGVPGGDLAAGMFAATAVVAALYERRRSGRGHDIDMAMQDSLVAMLTHQAARYLATDELRPSDHNSHASIAPYGLFEAADGHLNICVGNDAQFQRMCQALDLEDLGGDDRFRTSSARVVHKAELLAVLGPRLRDLPAALVIDRLEAAGVPVGAVRDLEQVLRDPEVRRRSMVVPVQRDGHGATEVVNGPWKVDGDAPVVRRDPPRLGEHTEELLAELADRSVDRPPPG